MTDRLCQAKIKSVVNFIIGSFHRQRSIENPSFRGERRYLLNRVVDK